MQCIAHFAGGAPATCDVECERLVDESYDGCRQRRADGPKGARRTGRGGDEQRARRIGHVDGFSGKQQKHRCADCPHVAMRPDPVAVAERVLGRHERRGAHHMACHGSTSVTVDSPRDPEIEDPNVPLRGDEQVLGLDIAMHHTVCMRARQHVEHTGHQHAHLGDGEAFVRALPTPPKGLPFEERHDQKRASRLVYVVVEHRDCPGMSNLIGEVCLAAEKAPHIVVVREALEQKLDCNAMPIAMRRSIDRRHTPEAEEVNDSILLLNQRPQTSQRAFRDRWAGKRSWHRVFRTG
ncbi:hypothetical protein LZC94_19645 [Pendulispora albinea]|uniref:Uncharacterized protein n=1 Tax=Pendulispora albinea TaxID=2741071 RepID=A0ABZ2MAC4_9BACT